MGVATSTGLSIVDTAAGADGAAWPLRVLQGTTATKLDFGAVVAGSTFTICSITRYAGATRGAILQGSDVPWWHGHKYNGIAGSSYYDSSSYYGEVSSATDWVAMCGRGGAGADTTGAVTPPVAVVNGAWGEHAADGVGTAGLGVNQGQYSTSTSDFQLLEIVTWDVKLSRVQMVAAGQRLLDRLGRTPPALPPTPPAAPPPPPSPPTHPVRQLPSLSLISSHPLELTRATHT
jgi:hypothetical protein